jgi:hypothetical protein
LTSKLTMFSIRSLLVHEGVALQFTARRTVPPREVVPFIPKRTINRFVKVKMKVSQTVMAEVATSTLAARVRCDSTPEGAGAAAGSHGCPASGGRGGPTAGSRGCPASGGRR